MQFSVNPDKIAIYDSIQQHYMLLYIHDIEEFELEDIQVLACNLEAKLQLTQKQQQIYQKLISISKQNTQRMKIKKKKNKDLKMTVQFSTFDKENQSFLGQCEGVELFNSSESFIYPKPSLSQSWIQVEKFIGIILDGNLLISLPIKHRYKLFENVQFQVRGEQKHSSITRNTSKMLKIDYKLEQTTLEVAQRQHLFVTNGKSNTLGLDFLTSHRVLLQCNYRQQVNKFTLSFTF